MSWTNLDIPPSFIEDSQEELRRYRRENTPLRKARRARIWAEVQRRMAEHGNCPDCRPVIVEKIDPRAFYYREQFGQMTEAWIDERERRMEVSE